MNKLSEKAKIIQTKLDILLAERKEVEQLYYLSALLDDLGFHLAVKVRVNASNQ